MAPEKTIEGKNVEEAVKIASETLNISVESLKYEVITYGSTGIFGLVGVKKAKIRVHLPEEKPENKEEIEEVVPAPANRSPKKYLEKKTGVKGKPKATKEKAALRVPMREGSKERAENRETSTSGEEKIEEIKTVAEKVPPVLPEELKVFADNPVALGKAVLLRILEMITVETDIEVEVEQDEDQVLYNVKGGKAAVLIGKRGQTLEAIQYLIEKIVNRISEKRVRLQIDVQGYLKNRKENLEQLATRLAEKAQRIGKPVTVGEMNVHDRKIVHMALKDHRHVRTQSMGSGFYRKLMIFPKKNGTKKEVPGKELLSKEVEDNG
ncbi:MAG: RNA-binding cell elongation regulator Jag/EloR [Pseudomonadota bacterium]